MRGLRGAPHGALPPSYLTPPYRELPQPASRWPCRLGTGRQPMNLSAVKTQSPTFPIRFTLDASRGLDSSRRGGPAGTDAHIALPAPYNPGLTSDRPNLSIPLPFLPRHRLKMQYRLKRFGAFLLDFGWVPHGPPPGSSTLPAQKTLATLSSTSIPRRILYARLPAAAWVAAAGRVPPPLRQLFGRAGERERSLDAKKRQGEGAGQGKQGRKCTQDE